MSACGQIDSEALVDCLRGKSEEEILAINKVRLSGCMYGGKGLTGVGNTSLSFSGQVIPPLGLSSHAIVTLRGSD